MANLHEDVHSLDIFLRLINPTAPKQKRSVKAIVGAIPICGSIRDP
jgi:hypothetical protein